jgi:phospholipid/cholesterol/gamma-HCH transport system ATP-binding protein
MTVFENIAFRLLRDFRMPQEKALGIAREKLALVGLEPEIADRMPSELSGGCASGWGWLGRSPGSGNSPLR